MFFLVQQIYVGKTILETINAKKVGSKIPIIFNNLESINSLYSFFNHYFSGINISQSYSSKYLQKINFFRESE